MNFNYRHVCHAVTIVMIMGTCGCSLDYFIEPPEKAWEAYNKMAEIGMADQQYDMAEENYLKVIQEFEKDSLAVWWDYAQLARIYIIQGRYDEAENAQVKYLEIITDPRIKNPPDEGDIARHYWLLGKVCLAQGRLDAAWQNLQLSSQHMNAKIEQQPQNAGAMITGVYPNLGRYYTELGEYEKAWEYFQKVLDFYISRHAHSSDLAIAKNDLGEAYYYSGDKKTAESMFSEAAGINAGSFVVFETDLAKSFTMLGRIEADRDADEKAKQHYQSALRSLQGRGNNPRRYRVEQADVYNEIGRFQLMRKKPDESRAAYTKAMQLRGETATDQHPNYADALRGLAGIAMLEGDVTSATQLTAQSLQILDKALVPTHPRIAPALVAMGSIHVLAGQPELARPLNERIETILQKPLGPWKEDFLETAAFYAERLKQAGKAGEAESLEQLRERVNAKQAGG